MPERRITRIEAAAPGKEAVPVKRVAGYARVSTELDEQQSSYAAQIAYYTEFIGDHEGWALAGIYTDEGITGTSTARREGFNRMIEDALSGRIDLIVTKSVSRFARNTVDSLTAIRRLKESGVEVFFEKENIWTMDSKGELLITIMSSLAQEESRSISENVTWGHRRRFAEGKVSLAYSRFLGYDRGEDGTLVINPAEAVTVRSIYNMYMEGLSFYMIARRLTETGVPTPCGNPVWSVSTVRSILMNEKYKGDALLQKTYTADFLTKRKKPNHGEVPQYYVQHSHEPIIPPELFDSVQQEHRRRAEALRQGKQRRYGGAGMFAGRIFCGCCGSSFMPRVWRLDSQDGRVFFQCSRKYRGKAKCPAPHVYAEELKRLFAEVSGRGCFDEALWLEQVERVTVYSRERIVFSLDGGEVAAALGQ